MTHARMVDLPGTDDDPDVRLAEWALHAALAGEPAAARAAVAELIEHGVVAVRSPAGDFEPVEGADGWQLVAVPWRIDDRDRADLAGRARLR